MKLILIVLSAVALYAQNGTKIVVTLDADQTAAVQAYIDNANASNTQQARARANMLTVKGVPHPSVPIVDPAPLYQDIPDLINKLLLPMLQDIVMQHPAGKLKDSLDQRKAKQAEIDALKAKEAQLTTIKVEKGQ